MHNQQKLTHIEQENGLKPHFGQFLALIGPFFGQQIFPALGQQLGTRYRYSQS